MSKKGCVSGAASSQATKKGDTLIEVIIATAVLAVISVLAISMMNIGVNSSLRALEITMANTAIEEQANLIRYVLDAAVTSPDLESSTYDDAFSYRELASAMLAYAKKKDGSDIQDLDLEINYDSCQDIYDSTNFQSVSFALNPRFVQANTKEYMNVYTTDILPQILITGNKLRTTVTHPRITYKALAIHAPNVDIYDVAIGQNNDEILGSVEARYSTLYRAVDAVEGLRVVAAKDTENSEDNPAYYDFYIQTCWNAAGARRMTTMTRIIRVYNSDQRFDFTLRFRNNTDPYSIPRPGPIEP